MKQHHVYFIRPVGQSGPIKIGCSRLPAARLEQLMTWSPLELEIAASVPGDFKLERNIHECFATEWLRREWFAPSDRLVAFVEKLRAGTPIEQAIDLTARSKLPTPKKRGPEFSLRMSYTHKLRWAAIRASGNGSIHGYDYRPPDDVVSIMAHWGGYRDGLGRVEQRSPTAAELARMDEVLADPKRHMVKRVWRVAA